MSPEEIWLYRYIGIGFLVLIVIQLLHIGYTVWKTLQIIRMELSWLSCAIPLQQNVSLRYRRYGTIRHVYIRHTSKGFVLSTVLSHMPTVQTQMHVRSITTFLKMYDIPFEIHHWANSTSVINIPPITNDHPWSIMRNDVSCKTGA